MKALCFISIVHSGSPRTHQLMQFLNDDLRPAPRFSRSRSETGGSIGITKVWGGGFSEVRIGSTGAALALGGEPVSTATSRLTWRREVDNASEMDPTPFGVSRVNVPFLQSDQGAARGRQMSRWGGVVGLSLG